MISPDTHIEIIICPNCAEREQATVEETIPFWTYYHECTKCKYLIMESEWECVEVPEIKNKNNEHCKGESKNI